METEHATSTLAQHTPGPWNVTAGLNHFYVRTPERYLAKTSGDDTEAQANARLIAAAPELLDMLRACSRVFNDPGFTDRAGYGERINAVINKAEGK